MVTGERTIAYEDGKIPEDMPCGVLSEDLVFNASTGHHGLAIEYLKVVAKVLDNGPKPNRQGQTK